MRCWPRVDDSEFMSETSAAAMRGAPARAHWILLELAGVRRRCTRLGGFAELDEVTVGQGQVIPSSKVQIVQNLEGGIVAEILVEPGQVVKKGQPLDAHRRHAILVLVSRRRREGQRAAHPDRTTRGRGGAQPLSTPPADLVRDKPELVQQERSCYDSRRRDFAAGLAVLQRQAEQRGQELAEMQARDTQLQHSYELVQQELAMMRPAAEKGVISKVELIRLERQANDLSGELEVARLTACRGCGPPSARCARRTDQYVGGVSLGGEPRVERGTGEQSVVSASNVALEDRLARTTVRAPVAGTIKQVKVTTVGGVVQPGMDLIEIVPLDDTLLVEARVRPEGHRVSAARARRDGQADRVRLLDLRRSCRHGSSTSVPTRSSTIAQARRRRATTWFACARRRPVTAPGSGTSRSFPGMQATVDIRTGRKTVLQYLLKPVLRAKQTALRER